MSGKILHNFHVSLKIDKCPTRKETGNMNEYQFVIVIDYGAIELSNTELVPKYYVCGLKCLTNTKPKKPN